MRVDKCERCKVQTEDLYFGDDLFKEWKNKRICMDCYIELAHINNNSERNTYIRIIEIITGTH